jgi:hypothetical protein
MIHLPFSLLNSLYSYTPFIKIPFIKIYRQFLYGLYGHFKQPIVTTIFFKILLKVSPIPSCGFLKCFLYTPWCKYLIDKIDKD